MRLSARHLVFLLLVSTGEACMTSPPSSPTEGIIRDLIAIANGADDTRLDQLLAPDFQRTADALSESVQGVEAMRALVRKMRIDMPDLHIEVLDGWYGPDRAAVRWRFSGTDSGPGDFPPTNRHATATGLSLYQVTEGRITREWTLVDGLSFLTQLGFRIVPPETASPPET